MTSYFPHIVALHMLSMLSPGRALVAVQKGVLAEVNSSTALLSMSGDSAHKLTWWQFVPHLQTDPEAFLRYLVSSPTPENQLDKLHESCDKDFTKEILDKGGLLSTRNLSIAEFQSEESVENDNTKVKLTLWMLSFVCLNTTDPACLSVAPVILRITSPKDSSVTRHTYFSVWEIASRQDSSTSAQTAQTAVTNSVPPRILELPNQLFYENTVFWLRSLPSLDDVPGVGIEFSSSDGVNLQLVNNINGRPNPGFTEAFDAGFYNYSEKCYIMGSKDFEDATGSKSLLVRGPVFLPQYVVDTSSCSGANVPVLFSNSTGFYACSRQINPNSLADFLFTCARFNCHEAAVKANLVPYFAAVYKVSGLNSGNNVEIEVPVAGACDSKVRVTAFNSPWPISGIESGCGVLRRAAKEELCLWGIEPAPDNSKRFPKSSSEVSILQTLFQQVQSSYSQAHVSAFIVEEGPAPDFWLSVLTMLSVCVVALIAVTDTLFRVMSWIKRPHNKILTLVRPILHLESLIQRVPEKLRTPLLCILNVALVFIPFSPVLALTPAELKRQRIFQTWGIHTDQVQITRHGLRVLILIQGESKYRSKVLEMAWISFGVLAVLVIFITWYKIGNRQHWVRLQPNPSEEVSLPRINHSMTM